MKRSHRRRAELTVVAAAAGIVAAFSPSGQAAGSDRAAMPTCAASGTDLQQSIEARRSNGFPSDAAFIQAVACGTHIQPSRIGVPITAGEDAELTRRAVVGNALASIGQQQKVAAPTSYVGSWVAPSTGVAVFAFVPGARPDEIAIRRALPAGTRVRFVTGAVTLARQDEIRAALVKGFAALRDGGVRIVGSDTDPTSGVVTIAIDQVNDRDAEARVSAVVGTTGVVIERVDPAVWATPQDARTQPTGRQYGGAYLSDPNNNAECTAVSTGWSPRLPLALASWSTI